MITIKEDIIVSYLERLDRSLVMFGSSNCGACNNLKPQLEKIEPKYNSIPFLFLDGDKHTNSADLFNVDYYPTMIIFEGEIPITRITTSDKNKIINLLEKYLKEK